MIQDLWEKNGEDAINVFQRPRRTKEQTGMNNTLEWISSRVTEAEEQVSDLEDRMVEITATYSLEYSLSIFLWKRLKSPKHGTINIPTILNSLIVILAREEKEKKKKKNSF